MDAQNLDALVEVGSWLKGNGYSFTTVTPATHARVLSRRHATASTLQDIFGWSLPFAQRRLPPQVLGSLAAADAVERVGDGRLRARVRCSALDDLLFFHSAYPTTDAEAVFFGPDTYRFARFIRDAVQHLRARPLRIVDVCCGTGAGGLAMARAVNHGSQVTLADINAEALRLARVNSRLADCADARCVQSDLLKSIEGPIDVLLANPPYLLDPAHRVYRDGGGTSGEGLSLRLVQEALQRLAPGGLFLLYTASAIERGGIDRFRTRVEPLLDISGFASTYTEIDPDVFGEELETAAYANAERIAVIGLTIRRLETS